MDLMISCGRINLGKVCSTSQFVQKLVNEWSGNLFLKVADFSRLNSIHNLQLPSFFFPSRTGAAKGLML